MANLTIDKISNTVFESVKIDPNDCLDMLVHCMWVMGTVLYYFGLNIILLEVKEAQNS